MAEYPTHAQIDRLLVDAPTAARLLSIGTRKLWELSNRNVVPGVVRLGRRVLYSRVALEAWITKGCPGAGSETTRRP